MIAFFRTLGATLLMISFFSAAPYTAHGADVVVIMPGGQALKVTVESETTVGQLKTKIYAISELSQFNQILLKGDTRLEDSRTLASYRIGENDTVVVKHGITGAPTSRTSTGVLWIVIGFAAIIGAGIFFMMRKPTGENPR